MSGDALSDLAVPRRDAVAGDDPLGPETLYDALLLHLAARLHAKICKAARKRPSYEVAKITETLAHTSYIASDELDTATQRIVRMLQAEPGVTLNAAGNLLLLDTDKLRLVDDSDAPLASTTGGNEVVNALVRRLACQIPLLPRPQIAIAMMTKKAVAGCTGLTAGQAKRGIVEGLIQLGCFQKVTNGDGIGCIAIDAACLQRPVTAFPDLSFLQQLPSAPTADRWPPAPRRSTNEPVLSAAASASRSEGGTLYDALIEHIVVHVHGAVYAEMSKKQKQFKVKKITTLLRKAGYVNDIQRTAQQVLQCVLRDRCLTCVDGTAIVAVRASPFSLPAATRHGVAALVQTWAAKIAIAPHEIASLRAQLHKAEAIQGLPGMAEQALDALCALRCMTTVRNRKSALCLGIDPSLVHQSLALFPDVSFLRSMASVAALSPTASSPSLPLCHPTPSPVMTSPAPPRVGVDDDSSGARHSRFEHTLGDALLYALADHIRRAAYDAIRGAKARYNFSAKVPLLLRATRYIPPASYTDTRKVLLELVLRDENLVFVKPLFVVSRDQRLLPPARHWTSEATPAAMRHGLVTALAIAPIAMTGIARAATSALVVRGVHDVATVVPKLIADLMQLEYVVATQDKGQEIYLTIDMACLHRPADDFAIVPAPESWLVRSAPAPTPHVAAATSSVPPTREAHDAPMSPSSSLSSSGQKRVGSPAMLSAPSSPISASSASSPPRSVPLSLEPLDGVVQTHHDTFLPAILAWVREDNPFYVSYVRGQVRSILPKDEDLDAAVHAVVTSLTQHPELIYYNTDRPCFVGKGCAPPDDVVVQAPPPGTSVDDDEDDDGNESCSDISAESNESDEPEPDAETPASVSLSPTTDISPRRVIAAYVQQVVAHLASGAVYDVALLTQQLNRLDIDADDIEDAVDAVMATLQSMPSVTSVQDDRGNWSFCQQNLLGSKWCQQPIVATEAPPKQPAVSWKSSVPCTTITTTAQLRAVVATVDVLNDPTHRRVLAIDAYGTWPKALVVVACTETTLIIDCVDIPMTDLVHAVGPSLRSSVVTKITFDVHRSAALLSSLAECCGLLDLQLLLEHETSRFEATFADMVAHAGLPPHPHPRYLDRTDFFNERPLRPEAVHAAAATTQLLLHASDALAKGIFGNFAQLLAASTQRLTRAMASHGQRTLCFDAMHDRRLMSAEYLGAWRPNDVAANAPVVVHEDLDDVLSLLPRDLVSRLLQPGVASKLMDIVLDLGRRPWAWVDGTRFFLDDTQEDRVVTRDDLDAIVDRVGGFGSDNRAGLERQLHRISAIRNRQDVIIALTIRVGRYIEGILFLGEPGCGKTTIVREVSRQLATTHNVCIVDTSNEIAGDGDVPHACVGLARRMMVPSLDAQAATMVECVQNHTPEVMVIDEIGRPHEVEAARTCKQRGVRIVASAHGDLRKLLKNKPLRGLVGGVESVTVGDALAKERQKKNETGPLRKLLAQRSGDPIFDIVVELQRGQYDTWRVVTDAASAVDAVLAGTSYAAQVRTRTASGDGFHLGTCIL
ncbi:hypothetical protein SPRG_03762 [Saprolegnia parasitica CBS 223.65]|uniref:AAA+ ATPase domain-containing protein n=1 Tax=Saprolegnia parasitica (strain CBS 223.65) TaxID=695850 RepID=A0A067CYG3_SAPPC|nr:hypothetical protein SPRG_03762 [Saprolegnia parasitica CBS 223.65]KDO31842.1 hypothetical protein SPRG_03762 [Saprolegnia parasitica CBS 223.65]|eukprot:XP_012197721.1 hypothetical protein SPRG_03762 [Saprolegnia parasitica CBS 223.65]